jgi:hypothetical protein
MEPILQELKGFGFDVETLADLRHQPRSFQEAVPMLLYWFTKVENNVVKEELARCLTLKKAPPIVGVTLVQEFLKSNDRFLKWAIGNALFAVADESILEQLVEIVLDKRHGTARQMIVLGLGKFHNDAVHQALLQLLEDKDVRGHAVEALGKLRYVQAREALVPFLNHEKMWIRKKAKQSIAAIDKEILRPRKPRKKALS